MFNLGDYVLVRTRDAGVFAGLLSSNPGSEINLMDARRLWYWSGAASLSQLSIDGVKKPLECKFPEAVKSVFLLGVIEILPVTDIARKSISDVPIWSV